VRNQIRNNDISNNIKLNDTNNQFDSYLLRPIVTSPLMALECVNGEAAMQWVDVTPLTSTL
jgi:hypothetical protein